MGSNPTLSIYFFVTIKKLMVFFVKDLCMDKNTTKKITVGNVCFIKDVKNKKVLLLHRKYEPMQGLYAGVGGKTLFDEDIKTSCLREIKEETGLCVSEISLRGVVKTIWADEDSSWILFVYTADKFEGELCDCLEGKLEWVDYDKVHTYNLVGMLKNILPEILEKDGFVEGTIVHDSSGKVLKEKLNSCV